MASFFSKWYRNSYFFQFSALFLPPALVIVLFGIYYYQMDRKNELFAISTHEAMIIIMGKGSIERGLDSLKSDLGYLSKHTDFKTFLNTHSNAHISHIADNYRLFMQQRGVYDQLRWIDENGMEKIRVDFNKGSPSAVSFEKLQYKGNRYYFNEAIKLPVGSIYFSPFDLNIENNKIEIPYKPMIRIATPVEDIHGHKRGIFIINYLGMELIRRFSLNTATSNGTGMILNNAGYWLKGSKPEDEWGFMHKRDDLTMAVRYPSVWKRIQKEEHGQFQDKNGLWTFETVYPLKDTLHKNQNSKTAEDGMRTDGYYWKVVSLVPSQKLSKNSDEVMATLLIIETLFLILTGIGSVIILHYRRKDQNYQKEIMKLSAVMEQIDDIVYITDKSGNINYVNEAFTRHTGYLKEEVIGKSSNLFKSGLHDQTFYEALWRTIKRGDVYRHIVINKKKNGDLYYEDKTITPVKDTVNAIMGFVSTGKDVTKETLLHQEIERLAAMDKLTGIYNRHKLEEIYAIEAERSRRFLHPLGLIMIDIDHFKSVNDTFGHEIGDDVIKNLVSIVQANIRKIDVFARWGGEEFLVLCPNTDFDNIQILAEKLRSAVENAVFAKVGHVTISLGISTLKGDDTFSDLFKRADERLYYAKEHGRNQVGAAE